MSAAEGGKSDLTTEGLDMPRFDVEYEMPKVLKASYVQGGDHDLGIEERHETQVFEYRDFHGHVFKVHVENVDMYMKPCPGPSCTAQHLDDRVDNFLRPRNVHMIGYDNAGVFRVQVPRFCGRAEAEDKVKTVWRDLLKLLCSKPAPTPKPVVKKEKPPAPDCRHG